MANIKISELSLASTPLTGTESIPLVQNGATLKATAQDIADLAGGGGGGTVNYATAQIIGAAGSPSLTYDLNTLFPTVTFTNVSVSMNLQVIISGGSESNDNGSFFYNIMRNNSFSPFWNYSSAYASVTSGSVMSPSFMFSGTEAAPTVQFYLNAGTTASFNMTIVTA